MRLSRRRKAIQFKLADTATKVEAARLLTLTAARLKDAGERSDLEARMVIGKKLLERHKA